MSPTTFVPLDPGMTSEPQEEFYTLPPGGTNARDEESGSFLPSQATVKPIRNEVIIQSLFDDRLLLRKPVHVSIEREGESYIARCDLIEEFGYGRDMLEAVDDLRLTVAELYWTLKSGHANLGTDLGRIYRDLQELIAEVRR